MVRWLITFSLRFPPVVLLLAVVMMVAGVVSLRRAQWDVFPEFAPPQIVVQTEAPGFSTEEVEQLIAIPVESALNGLSRLKVLRSSSVPGLSVATAIFEEGTGVLDARQLVSERLAQVRELLPDAAETPRMMPLTSSTSRLVMIGLTSDKVSPMQLRTLADWTFRRRLQAVPGVAHVEVGVAEGEAWAQPFLRTDSVLLDTLKVLSFNVDPRWRAIARNIPRGARVLDAGCGMGTWPVFLAGKGYNPVGLDFSQQMIDLLRKRYPQLEWVQSMIQSIPLPDASVDGIISWGVIEHDGPRLRSQIAAILEVPEGTSRAWLFEAKKGLQRLLTEAGQ
jgi:hypothetical protein